MRQFAATSPSASSAPSSLGKMGQFAAPSPSASSVPSPFGKMGQFAAPSPSRCGMGNFNHPPTAVKPRTSLEPSWRKPRGLTSPLTQSHLSPTSSSPQGQSSLTTRLKPAGSVSWDAFGAARLSGRPAPRRAGANQVLECVVGRVVHLPSKHLIPAESVVHEEAAGSPWDHPQVITKTWVDGDGVEFVKLRSCTSFHGHGIEHKKVEHRHYFTEADKSQLTPESDVFCKQTYVNCSPGAEMTIEFQHLIPWSGARKEAIQFSAAALATFNRCEPDNEDSFI